MSDLFDPLKSLEKHLGEYDFNSRVPFYNDSSDYTTNAPSYYDDLARKNKLIKHLALRIWEYDKELGKRFKEWDQRIEDLPDELKRMFLEWVDDGTLARILEQLLLEEYATKEEVYQFLNILQNDLNRVIKFNNNFINISDYENLVINNDWTPAFNQAIEDIREGGTLKIDQSVEIFNDVIVDKQVNIIGTGYHQNPDMYQYATLYIGRYCQKGLVITEHASTVKSLNIEGVDNNISNGLTIESSRITVRDVSIHKMGGHGLLVGNTLAPMNLSLFTGLYITTNNKDGIHLNYGDASSTVASDIRACTFIHIDTRSNNGNGLFVGNAHDDTFVSFTAQENKGYGVLLSGRSGGNKFYTLYSERNEAFGDENPYSKEVLMEEGSRDNFIDGQRTGIVYQSITDLGNNNYNYTTNKQGRHKSWNYLSTDALNVQNENAGMWLFQNNKSTDLDIILDGTSAQGIMNIDAYLQTQRLKVGNSKYMSDFRHLSKSIQIANLSPNETYTLEVFNDLTSNSIINYQVRNDTPFNNLLIHARKSSNNIGYIDITNIGNEMISNKTLTFSMSSFDIQQ